MCFFFLCFSSPARVAFGWKQKKKKKKKKKKNWGSQNQSCWPSVSCAQHLHLHLQTRLSKGVLCTAKKKKNAAHNTPLLSGRRSFFTVIARRKKNFLLLRSWMEVDDRVNVSNHYSKKHDARHSCTFAKALKTPRAQPLRRPLARIRRKQASYTV